MLPCHRRKCRPKGEIPLSTRKAGWRLRALILASILAIGVVSAMSGGVASAGSTPTPKPSLSGQPRSITVSSPVAPAAVPTTCTSGNVCFWKNAGFNDGPGKLANKNPDWSAFAHPSCPSGTWNDCASSLANAGVNCNAVLWNSPNYKGDTITHSLTLTRGSSVQDLSNLGDAGSAFNDKISSNSWAAPTGGTNSTCTGPV